MFARWWPGLGLCSPSHTHAQTALLRHRARGEFGLDTLAASTRALASNSPGDATYTSIEGDLTQLGAARDALVGEMQAVLMGAEFGGQPAGSGTLAGLTGAGNALLAQADALAAG